MRSWKRGKREYGKKRSVAGYLIIGIIMSALAVGIEGVPYQKVNRAEWRFENKYYYSHLSEAERIVYEEILQGVEDEVKEIYVHCGDAGRANEIVQYMLKDFPEIFWVDGTATSTSYGGRDIYTVVKPVYLYEGTKRNERREKIESEAAMCLEGVSETATDYEKILHVYEYVVNMVEYRENARDNQNICSVFIGKTSVCAGYAKAVQYLLERLGVFCTYVTGTVEGGAAHAWNLVQCDGDYYYVDATWGDPVFQESEEGEKRQDYIRYDYMCCDDQELLRTHMPDDEPELPACTKMTANYYVVNGMYYEVYDREEAMNVMNEGIRTQAGLVIFKYANTQVYEQARRDLLDTQIRRVAQNLAEWYGLSEVKYSYIDDDKLNKITIFWKYS